MSPLITAEAVVGALLAVVIGGLAFVYIRRRLIAAGKPLIVCALRAPHSERWRLGLLRLGADRLDWFSVAGPSLRPEHEWERVGLDLGAPAPVVDAIPGLPDGVEVDALFRGHAFGLALAPASYTAMRSWLESAPPGFNANVA